jgi:beta-xylosidase
VIGGDKEGWVGGEIPPFTAPEKPVVDVPMRDPGICRGPDNNYYLIGTTQDSMGGPKGDWWKHNRGIEMWKSPDLRKWEYLGYVWTFEKDAKADWQKGKLNADGTRTPKPLWAPELHYIKENWYISCCVERLGCIVLKSTTGRPEGPYADLSKEGSIAPGPLYDASLFEDDDGQVYLLCAPGAQIARMKPDLSGLAEPLRHVTVAPGTKWHNCEGPTMVKLNGRYYLMMAQGTYHSAGGRAMPGEEKTYDTWAISAPTPYGPFEKRHLAFPRGGHNVVFQDHTGRWWSTWGTRICASDPGMSKILNSIPFYEKPGIIPIEMDSEGKLRQAPSRE